MQNYRHMCVITWCSYQRKFAANVTDDCQMYAAEERPIAHFAIWENGRMIRTLIDERDGRP